MHLLAAVPGTVETEAAAVDLDQTPGDIVVLSAADTELSVLAAAQARRTPDAPTLRLANLLQLRHNLSVDLHVDKVVRHARLVVVRLLGGTGYWPYGIDRVAETCRRLDIGLAALPGDHRPDPDLARLSTVTVESAHRLWQYLVHGGAANADGFLSFAAHLAGAEGDWTEPLPLLPAGLCRDGSSDPETVKARWTDGNPVAAIVFYRALVQAGNTEPVDALAAALEKRGLNPLPIFVQSLKDELCADVVEGLLAETPPAVIVNATGFAVSAPGAAASPTPFSASRAPVLQTVLAAATEASWAAGDRGLTARDIAMNVALPEVDGRIVGRAIAFKSERTFDPRTQISTVEFRSVPDRVEFAADLAAAWARLRATAPSARRVGIVLANYPNRDGRVGNGVGLDTPAGTVELLRAMAAAGHDAKGMPENGEALVSRLLAGPTNAGTEGRRIEETLPLAEYEAHIEGLGAAARRAVAERWGPPSADPFFLEGEGGRFAVPAFRCGNVAIGLQPARGYNIDPAGSYHDPALVPPHGYLAFYAWLRNRCDVVVHMGKHGNLEWLPGKSLALSADCFPEAALGPTPNVCPFIVNDPGEGTQAKRRAAAVVVDHLTPPLARAETYGPLAELERLVDEYYDAAGVDPRRVRLLGREILQCARDAGLDADCGISAGEAAGDSLAKLDNYLCELKEMQIRDGLHVFGRSPEGPPRDALLVALARLPRGDGTGRDASLTGALAADLGLGAFDPLDCALGDPWTGPRPAALAGEGAWRTNGDAVERLEALALDLVAGRRKAAPSWTAARAVLDGISETLGPAVDACGGAEIAGTLAALDGTFVPPGPSGAPTRGRTEVLPTGRNFYSVDTRAVPTRAAWTLGWKSASLLVERHVQEHGEWPRRMALSAWGTSNMRTGGDDLAQALALMGVRPQWTGGRVTGFEILPADALGRPRVDVTLRLSGFFRDAFPHQIDLFDAAVRAVAALDEPADRNPLAAQVAADADALAAAGADPGTARRRAAHRVFGSRPGAYGAGLQALIDERGWKTDADLASAYVAWGGYAYGGGAEGAEEHGLFRRRLGGVDAVVHNQDNREHDLLDSDDYYQFEGGLAAAVRNLSGRQPAVWHNDHSRPETPRVRTLEDEIGRVVRARVVNPKWIAGVMRHGYKGAFEIAATVDYLFAFAATARCVSNRHFDLVFEAYLGDPEVLRFLEDSNPDALGEIANRLLEACERELWRPRSNAAYDRLAGLGSARR